MFRTSVPDTQSAVDRNAIIPEAATPQDEISYFQNTKAPDYLPRLEEQVSEFVAKHAPLRRIAVVTSGGTTVPLENNTVRFIDNFSAGTRGSASAEQLLQEGYAVIFVHREFSLLPWGRLFQHTMALDLFEETKDGRIDAKPEYKKKFQNALRAYNDSRDRLLLVPFTTVSQYLYTLRSVALRLRLAAGKVLFFLAAAVSDFFLPESRVPNHKIQSNNTGELVIHLDPVPKFLRRLVETWVPGAMIVSFKLETDEEILQEKCQNALDRYGHELVVGNLLQTRKKEVWFVYHGGEDHITLDDDKNHDEIENIFVPRVIDLHTRFINEHKTTY